MGIGALPAGIFTAFHPMAGAALTACWMWTGLMLEDAPAPYTRKQGPLREGARAFFSWCCYAFIYTLFHHIGVTLGFLNTPVYFLYTFSVPIWAYILLRKLPLGRIPPIYCMLISFFLLIGILLL